MSLSLSLEITTPVAPPRALVLHYPFGHPLGEVGNLAQQEQIFWDALGLLEEPEGPVLVESPYLWRRTLFPLKQT